MKRIAAVLGAAVLASGCIISDDDPGAGTVNVYWEFLRYAPAAASDGWVVDANGFVTYDLYDTIHPAGTFAPCQESGVEVVEVRIAGSSPQSYDCIHDGVQGIAFDGIPEGRQALRLTGWRTDRGTQRALWDQAYTVDVRRGAEVSVAVAVEPLAADVDLLGYLSAGGTPLATCSAAGNPDLDTFVHDSLGTPVLALADACAPANAGAYPFPLFGGVLDLDYYSARSQGFLDADATADYDSCWWEFDHYAASVGANAWELDLVNQATCP